MLVSTSSSSLKITSLFFKVLVSPSVSIVVTSEADSVVPISSAEASLLTPMDSVVVSRESPIVETDSDTSSLFGSVVSALYTTSSCKVVAPVVTKALWIKPLSPPRKSKSWSSSRVEREVSVTVSVLSTFSLVVDMLSVVTSTPVVNTS